MSVNLFTRRITADDYFTANPKHRTKASLNELFEKVRNDAADEAFIAGQKNMQDRINQTFEERGILVRLLPLIERRS